MDRWNKPHRIQPLAMPRFDHIRIVGWRQFDDIAIDFHPRMTVLTGANGAGKTTLLKLLSVHFGWNFKYASTLGASKRGLRYIAGVWRRLGISEEAEPSAKHRPIGELAYSNGTTTELTVPAKPGTTFNIGLTRGQAMPGVYVASHRPPFVYQSVNSIPTNISLSKQMFDNYVNELKARFNPNARQNSPTLRMKEAIISLATLGFGNRFVEPNEQAVQTFEGFQAILRHVLPPSVGFREIRVHLPDVMLVTESGDFALDDASGGLASIIDLAWQVFLAFSIYDEFTVVIDEPENHLHPKMQLSLLDNFLDAFPTAQFVVATHSPLIVGSVKDSAVYMLDFADTAEGTCRVRSHRLDLETKAGTANEILRQVLGVETSMPIWVQNEIDNVFERYASVDMTREQLEKLRADIKSLGLDEALLDLLIKE